MSKLVVFLGSRKNFNEIETVVKYYHQCILGPLGVLSGAINKEAEGITYPEIEEKGEPLIEGLAHLRRRGLGSISERQFALAEAFRVFY